MTSLRARLDPKTISSNRRTAHRRMLHLPAEGLTISGTSDVLILDMSTIGLLLETSGDLSEGESIELDITEDICVRVVVKWSSGQLFGCKFQEPISTAAVSAAMLRASYAPRSSSKTIALSDTSSPADYPADASRGDEQLSLAVKMRWIIGLALLSWGVVIAAASLVWTYVR